MRDNVPLLVVPILLIAAVLLLFRGGEPQVSRTVMGVGGLHLWLQENDVPVQMSHRRRSPGTHTLSLRILPLHDLDLQSEPEPPATREELMKQTTQRNIHLHVLEIKLEDMPSLLALPKWRTGFMIDQVAHKGALVPEYGVERVLRQIGLSTLRLNRDEPAFFTDDLNGQQIALFHAQLFDRRSLPSRCTPEVDTALGPLMIRCRLFDHDHDTLILSDPDLINNHGLSVAANAGAFLGWLTGYLDGDVRPVYIDTSPRLLTTYEERAEERRDYKRDADDLSRYFQFPFSVLWAMLLVVLGMLYWRGARRFGPVDPLEDGNATARSKTAAITAKARLLRLSGNDGKMVSDFVRGQVQDMTVSTFGPDLGQAGQKRFFAHLARRDADLARAFETCATDLMARAPTMPQGELYRTLGQYTSLLEKLQEHHGTL